MKMWFKFLILFIIGGIGYNLVEIVYRGYSHWTMTLLGGFCFVLIGCLNEYRFEYEEPIWIQAAVGMMLVTLFEFFVGVVVNMYCGMCVWDYSHMKLNLFGQIALLPSVWWFFLSIGVIMIDDYLRHILFKEPLQKHNFGISVKRP